MDKPHRTASQAIALRWQCGAFVLILGLVLAPGVRGQSALSTIRGTVVDSSDAVVPGVAVVVTEVSTNVRARSVVSDDRGNYEIPDLKPGIYRLTAELAGFKSFIAEGLVLDSGQVRRIDVALEIGEATEHVTVESGSAVITTDTGTVSGSVTSLHYKDAPIVDVIPYPGWQGMLSTLPGVVGQGWNVSIAGQSGTGITLQDDGVQNDRSGNQSVNMNTYEEVKVVTVNNTADQARAASLNTTTKRGSNTFRGTAYYKHTNSSLGARSFFAPEKTPYKFHDAYVELGGPIIRDRTFFYVGWTHIDVPASSFPIASVPTQRMRQGDFSQFSQQIVDPLTGEPFRNNRIPANRINPTSRQVQDLYLPEPNLGGADELTNNHGYLFPYPDDYFLADYPTFRVDHNLTGNNSMFFRYMYYYSPYVLANDLPGFARTRTRYHDKAVFSDTHVFSSSLLNTFRFGLNGNDVKDGITVDGFTPPFGNEAVSAIGLLGVNPNGLQGAGFPRMDIAGLTSLQTPPGGILEDGYDWSLDNAVTWATGRHVVKFGVQYNDFNTFRAVVEEGTYGAFEFDGTYTGIGYADFLLGIPFSSARRDPLQDRWRRASELGLYVMDTFRLASNLTVDYGLRWDYFASPSYSDGLQYNWDPQTGNVIVPQEALSSVAALYPDPITVQAGDVVPNAQKSNFRPRLGVAYRLRNDLVLRGGYGVYTERLSPFARANGGGPFDIEETYFNRIENGRPLFSFPNPFPDTLAEASVPSQSVSGYPMTVHNGYIHQFNVSVEKQIANVGLRLSYVGSRGRGLNYTLNINKPEPSLVPFSSERRPYPQLVEASFVREDGASNYDSLQVEAVRRAGLITFNANYTWSSSLQNFLNTENPYDVTSHWSRDASNPRHRAVISTMIELPWGRGQRFLSNAPAVVDQILGGWRLQTISYLASGKYFSPGFSGFDPSGTNTSGGLPDRVCDGNLPRSDRAIERWFDTSCFAVPPAGRFGNSGVNVLEGPGLNVHHLSLVKRFRLNERFTLTYNAAVSNLFNHPHFDTPRSDISTSNPGQITSTPGWSAENESERRISMLLRLEW
jgi:hypothetical protein